MKAILKLFILMALSVAALASFLWGIIGFFTALFTFTDSMKDALQIAKFSESASNSIIMIFFGIYTYFNFKKWGEDLDL